MHGLGIKGSPTLEIERRVPELIPVLGSHPAGDRSHKPGGMLPLLSTRPAIIYTQPPSVTDHWPVLNYTAS